MSQKSRDIKGHFNTRAPPPEREGRLGFRKRRAWGLENGDDTKSNQIRVWLGKSQLRHPQEQTDTSKQPIKTRYLGHVTGCQPIRDQYYLIYFRGPQHLVMMGLTVTVTVTQETLCDTTTTNHLSFYLHRKKHGNNTLVYNEEIRVNCYVLTLRNTV
eukprot:sb/3473111/